MTPPPASSNPNVSSQPDAQSARILPAAIDAPRDDLPSEFGERIHYYADTSASGTPVVLIHSINAAPSAHEMKPLFERLRGKRPVYALDLPGFGHSDRSKRVYSPELFANAILDFLRRVVKAPADLIAFSLGCEFAARATLSAPDLVTSLVLISPTGFNARNMPSGKTARRVHGVLNTPLLSDALYNLVTTRPSIRYFYGQAFVGKVPSELVDYASQTTSQPGAKHAPLYFLSGQLFTQSADEVLYAKIAQPVLVLYDRDPNVHFHTLPDLLGRLHHWRAKRITPTSGMLQWEKPDATVAAIETFWGSRP